MTLSDRIAFQRSINPEINEVWLPADVVLETIAKAQAADAYKLKADAYDREERRLRRRREAIPEPRRRSIAAQIIDQDSRKDRV